MSNLAIRLYPEVLRELAFGSISGTYMGMGSALSYPSRIFWVTNNTDVELTYSINGVDDHFKLPANGFLLLDVSTNQSANGGILCIAQGDRLYVKGSPTSGSTYLSSWYGKN